MPDIDTGLLENASGDVETKGTYRIYKDGDITKVDLYHSTKITGISGTGNGFMGFAFLDENGEPILREEHYHSVGSDVIRGVNKKKYNKTITIFDNEWNKVHGVSFNVKAKENDPIDIQDVWGTLREVIPFLAKLAIGELSNSTNWLIKRIK
ncbi:hypothetical protein [Bacillus cereus]|uniref:hypothetical protein n=1 Tax=Bacillus cereus TaxID=1396 RepID=UPI000BFA0D16|nr:hypothetical protein [Bacillus cereus]PFT75998.1 hypothetical protein COK74_25780 [Bacillus cereus]